jgi:hypothetical protein
VAWSPATRRRLMDRGYCYTGARAAMGCVARMERRLSSARNPGSDYPSCGESIPGLRNARALSIRTTCRATGGRQATWCDPWLATVRKQQEGAFPCP